jgi:hypothetical protein
MSTLLASSEREAFDPVAVPNPIEWQRRKCEQNIHDRRHQAQCYRQSRRILEQMRRTRSNHAAFEEADPKADEFSLRAERGADSSIGECRQQRSISLDLVPGTGPAGKDCAATGW